VRAVEPKAARRRACRVVNGGPPDDAASSAGQEGRAFRHRGGRRWGRHGNAEDTLTGRSGNLHSAGGGARRTRWMSPSAAGCALRSK
jgi:hypothetical protein